MNNNEQKKQYQYYQQHGIGYGTMAIFPDKNCPKHQQDGQSQNHRHNIGINGRNGQVMGFKTFRFQCGFFSKNISFRFCSAAVSFLSFFCFFLFFSAFHATHAS